MVGDSRAQRPSSAAPPDAPDAAIFQKLADQWRQETGYLSSPVQIAMHPAYREIMSWGERALPYIFKDLRTRGGQWYWALRHLTGASPVPREAAGNARKVREAWLQWGRDHGYIS